MKIQNPIGKLSPMNETDLREMLDDGPRAGCWNPTPDEVQKVLAEIHDEMGDRNPQWSSDVEDQDDNIPF